MGKSSAGRQLERRKKRQQLLRQDELRERLLRHELLRKLSAGVGHSGKDGCSGKKMASRGGHGYRQGRLLRQEDRRAAVAVLESKGGCSGKKMASRGGHG
jgi:hypothetical protein